MTADVNFDDERDPYEVIMDAIVTQELAPSQKISEYILSDKFGIRRTVCRNLIERLIAKQFLVNVSQRVTLVAPLTLLEIKQNFALRKMLLPEVVALVARSADFDGLYSLNQYIQSMLPITDDRSALEVLKVNKQINLTLCETAGYPLMLDWIQQLEDTAMRIYWLYIKTKNDFPLSGVEEAMVFDAMKTHSPEKASKMAYNTLVRTEEQILNAIVSHEQFYTQDLKV